MTIEEIVAHLAALGGVHTLAPAPGDGTPEIAWGDYFFYYAPDGRTPTRGQPFATIVTKDYPDDERSHLHRPNTFRLNISATTEEFRAWTGHAPRDTTERGADPAQPDTLVAHPVYGGASWLSVVNPGPNTDATVRALLASAHERARLRHER
ncbi:DUF6194 family protein [Nocardia takedensis]